jgi:hypothetical protein
MKKFLSSASVLLSSLFYSQIPNLDWHKDLVTPGDKQEQITSLLQINSKIICGASNEAAGYILSCDDSAEEPTFATTTSTAFISWIVAEDTSVYTKEGCVINKRSSIDFSSVDQNCLLMDQGWEATTPVAALSAGKVYCSDYQYLAKFDVSGTQLFKKTYATLATAKLLAASSSVIYLYSYISAPVVGNRMSQFDLSGNLQWTKDLGTVMNMVTDPDGSLYISMTDENGVCYIAKYSATGSEIWKRELTGQLGRGLFRMQDNLYVCGNISLSAVTDNGQSCAYSVLSATSGELIDQKVTDLYADVNESEQYTHIFANAGGIYIAGTHGDASPAAFLTRFSTGQIMGRSEKSESKPTFILYPNPSGNKFSVTANETMTGNVEITMYNNQGAMVYKTTIKSNAAASKWDVDFGKQTAGTYTIEIKSEKGTVTKKLVVN